MKIGRTFESGLGGESRDFGAELRDAIESLKMRLSNFTERGQNFIASITEEKIKITPEGEAEFSSFEKKAKLAAMAITAISAFYFGNEMLNKLPGGEAQFVAAGSWLIGLAATLKTARQTLELVVETVERLRGYRV